MICLSIKFWLLLLASSVISLHAFPQNNNEVKTLSVGTSAPQLAAVFNPKKLITQKKSEWCIPASLEFIMTYHGTRLKQRRIVKRIWGDRRNEPITGRQLKDHLENWVFRLSNGKKAKLNFEYSELDKDVLISELEKKWLLIALFGNQNYRHANVVLSVNYHHKDGEIKIESLKLYDPLIKSEYKEMSWSDFQKRTPIIVKVRYILVD